MSEYLKPEVIKAIHDWLADHPEDPVRLAEIARSIWGNSARSGELRRIVEGVGRKAYTRHESVRLTGAKKRAVADERIKEAVSSPGADEKLQRTLAHQAKVDVSTFRESLKRQGIPPRSGRRPRTFN